MAAACLYAPPMVRIMLALLALLGFAAQAVPAQARLSGAGGAEVGSVEARPAPVGAVFAKRSPVAPAKIHIAAGAEIPRWHTVRTNVLALTVRLRIDRSHE